MSCPSCGKEVPGEFPFCPFCGAALAGEPRTPGREERKVVTVLFVDLVGFTARSERLDPEDVRALLAPYHAHLRSELERFGGTVEKFIGDAVMALFGAPMAHEDDPERAVRAALAIRDWAREQGEELQVRIAVNTGEALVSLDARPSEGEAMAAGDVVNTAARMQAAAPLNGVLAGELTYRATAQAVEYREAEPVVGKGKSEPIRVWEAVQARSRLGIDVSRETQGLIVGRTRELELLVSTLARVREERAPQLVTLVGVPGIGKSRLVAELLGRVEQAPELVIWRQGRSLPYGEGVTFWALAEIVKAQAGILESDTPHEANEKLVHAVRRVATDAPDEQWLERYLRPLAGLAEEDATGLAEAFAAWRRYLEAIAEERPLVLVFEDLHWADDAMLDFVDQLAERVGGVPLLVLGTARPELLQRRSGWGGGKSNALTISLSPLSDDETAALVGALLDQPLLEAQLQQALLARAGGNPLYAEQYARALQERGDVSELPETVQGIIAARLDGLAEKEKRLLQDASVIGKVFWVGALGALDAVDRTEAEDLLHALERKEFVERARSSSIAGEREYAFRHLLVRDVAYGQIPRSARSEKHRRAAGWLESLGRPEDQAELLAHHYLLALELAEAAGLDTTALAEPARHALRDAGDRAAALYALGTAERFYDAALRLWPADDSERAQLLLRRAAPARDLVPDGMRLEEARDALLAAGDNVSAAEAEALLSRVAWYQGRVDLAKEHGERAVTLIAGAPPSRARVSVILQQATRAAMGGDQDKALELASAARALAEEIGWTEGVSSALMWVAEARVNQGDRNGLDDLTRAIDLAQSAGALGTLSRAYNNLATNHVVLGDLEAASRAGDEAWRIVEQIGSAEDLRWFEGVSSDDRYRRGAWAEALRLADSFLATVEAGSPHYVQDQAFLVRAVIRLARGDASGAIRDAERALDHGRTIPEAQVLYYDLQLSAHVLAVAEGPTRALPLVHEVLDALREGVDLQFAVIALPAFTATAHRLGLDDELLEAIADRRETPWIEAARAYARGDFSNAADVLRHIGTLPDEAEARLRAAQRLVAEGRRPEADEQLRQALAFYRSVDATYWIAECEALLAASA